MIILFLFFSVVGYSNMDTENVNFGTGDMMFQNPTFSLGRTNKGMQLDE